MKTKTKTSWCKYSVERSEFRFKILIVPRTCSMVGDIHHVNEKAGSIGRYMGVTHYLQIFWLWWVVDIDFVDRENYDSKLYTIR